MRKALLLLLIVSACTCAHPEVLVRDRAAKDFRCSPADVSVEKRVLSDSGVEERFAPWLFVASGCLQRNGYQVTGEWGWSWAVPCDPHAGPVGAFTAADPSTCAALLPDAGVR
jgi:hypothetical protein